MSDGTFKAVSASDEQMYGPRKILACGYPPEEHAPLTALFKEYGFADFPLVFVSKGDENRSLKEIVSQTNTSTFHQAPGAYRAIILSGFTNNELLGLLSAFRSEKTARPLMATLTPASENWTLRHLITELSLEAETMKRLRRKNAPISSSKSQK